MSWPAGWCRGPNWPAAWTEAQRLEAERACDAPRARDAPPPPPLKRRVSFREDKLCDVFEYEKEEEEPEPEPVMLAYKAVPKTRHSALSLFRDARLPALVAAGAFLYLRPFANAGENAVAIVVAIGGVGVLVAVAAAAVLGSDTVLDEAAKAAVIIELGVLVLTVLLPLAAGVARLPGQHKGAKIPTSKAHISVGIHSFWLIFGRVIISRHGLEA